MATGNVWYWNGISGWIKRTGVEQLATCEARDVMVLLQDVDSGTVVRDCAVTFTTYAGTDPWLARDVVVT